MLLSGMRPTEICKKVMELWGVRRAQTERYISRCYDNWGKYFSRKAGKQLDYQKAKRADLFSKPIQIEKITKNFRISGIIKSQKS